VSKAIRNSAVFFMGMVLSPAFLELTTAEERSPKCKSVTLKFSPKAGESFHRQIME
jgi:hypothetical protein